MRSIMHDPSAMASGSRPDVPVVFAMPGYESFAGELATLAGAQRSELDCRRFPDGETYVRVLGDPSGEDIWLVCTLARPDLQFLPLVFASRALRSAGARSLTLVAPYLAYMRQDRAFHAAEAISSRIFADLIGREFDRLITVDPHLHRYASLGDIYVIPTIAVHAAGLIGSWVRDHVPSPVILGPDAESAQWIEKIAAAAGCPWNVFRKERRGDREVALTPPPLKGYANNTPVLADDIISSGATMLEAATLLIAGGLQAPYCIAVHALFDEKTASEIRGVAQELLTTDTIPNGYSAFGVAPLIARQLATAMA